MCIRDRFSSIAENANDLYKLMLLDNQVSSKVITSKVASATASIQQYINSMMLKMETGSPSIEQEEADNWNGIGSQYAVWSANQALQDTPEIYIDPTLRYTKSKYFQELENGLNKGKINESQVQEVVLDYLGKFEEVSNLQTVSYTHLTLPTIYSV